MAGNVFEMAASGSGFLAEFFEYLLTEEEAEFLLLLPSLPIPLGEVVEKAATTEEKARRMLEALIHKTVVEDFEAQGVEGRLFGRASIIALAENYMHRYIDLNDPNPSEIHVKFGRWFEALKNSDYHDADEPKLGRIIPIERALADTREIVPTSRASEIVDEASYISVMRCPCRSSGHLAGNACDGPLEVCFSMNDYARYQVEYGFAREVTKEWAKKTLRECEERGLVHATDNVRGNYNMLCNCCACHCIGLVGYTKSNQVPRLARTGFLCSVDLEECTGSGLCAEECQYDAIAVEGEKARVDESRCIGCGVCTTACPTEALSLKARSPERAEKYYESKREYFAEMPPEKIDGDIENAEYIH